MVNFFSSARDQTCKLWYKSIIPRKFINIHVYGQQCFWCIFLQIGNYLSENHGKWRKIDSLLEKVKCALLCDGSSTSWKFNSPRYSSILSLFFSETKISQILKLSCNGTKLVNSLLFLVMTTGSALGVAMHCIVGIGGAILNTCDALTWPHQPINVLH